MKKWFVQFLIIAIIMILMTSCYSTAKIPYGKWKSSNPDLTLELDYTPSGPY